jgi:hypothetical protein
MISALLAFAILLYPQNYCTELGETENFKRFLRFVIRAGNLYYNEQNSEILLCTFAKKGFLMSVVTRECENEFSSIFILGSYI